MADALVSPPVAIMAGVAAVSLLVVATRKVARSNRTDIIPMMGVMGAFVFAAQMINSVFPAPGQAGTLSEAYCSQPFWGRGLLISHFVRC